MRHGSTTRPPDAIVAITKIVRTHSTANAGERRKPLANAAANPAANKIVRRRLTRLRALVTLVLIGGIVWIF
jgi:hypothetical protein